MLADRTVPPHGSQAKFCYQRRDTILSCRQERAAERQRGLTVAVGEQATMPDLDKPGRQHVHQEPTDELAGLECHQLLGVVIGRVAPAECDLIIFNSDEPSVGDGNAVRVICQILEHVLRAAEGTLDADHPFLGFERTQKAIEDFCLPQGVKSTREPEFTLSIRGGK